ncbi:MAG TPA: pyridoxamine 5'-phosphate oxidase family protein [Candidatus Saccharimonadales bacterium]|nr:pyridoxamine 5'-phosphate oxidase family protein [Candidatus Saccharimonadales bacterium]
MDDGDVAAYLEQYRPGGKLTMNEAELRYLLGRELLNRAKEIRKAKMLIKKIIYITIATSNRKSVPWNSPVFCAYDKNYNFYWISAEKTVHSINIEQNENVALVIYDSTVPEGAGFGVYIKAKASEVRSRKEVRMALSLLYKRKHQAPPSPMEFMGRSRRKVYKAVPVHVWTNDLMEKQEDKLKFLRFPIKLV